MNLKKFRITYNAPVVLTFCIIATVIFFLGKYCFTGLTEAFFVVRGKGSLEIPDAFSFTNPLDYFRLLFHVFGHTDFVHLSGNLCFLLLLGPVLEQKYGSVKILLMMIITSLVSGFVNAVFLVNPMCGASDIIFMMILLVSYTSINKTEIPLSFILIFILYVGKEFYTDVGTNIATVAHIAGGICGSLFAFIFSPDKKEKSVSVSEFSKKSAKSKSKNELRRSSRKTQSESSSGDSDSTIVGSIEL